MPLGYRMDRLTGRLAFTAAEPVPILKSSAAEKPISVRGMSDLKTALHVHEPIKQTEMLGKTPDNPAYRKLQEKQRLMMRPDGKLIWQKLPMDRPLFLLTVGLCGLGLVMGARQCYRMAYNMKD